MNCRIRYRELIRTSKLKAERSRLINKEVTIFSSNCIGGVIYHDLGLRFMSPTINLFMRPSDFIRFLSNVQHYVQCDLKELNAGETYPCGDLDGVRIDFVHYRSFSEAKAKWNARSARINLSNCCAIMADRDGCTQENARAFDALPIDQKAFLTARALGDVHCEVVNGKWAIDSENLRGGVRDLCSFRSPISATRWLDDFDYVKFLNGAGGIRER